MITDQYVQNLHILICTYCKIAGEVLIYLFAHYKSKVNCFINTTVQTEKA
jgi:hypothetical protein